MRIAENARQWLESHSHKIVAEYCGLLAKGYSAQARTESNQMRPRTARTTARKAKLLWKFGETIMQIRNDDPETHNPGALCFNCRHCHIPRIDGFFAYDLQQCRAPSTVKISRIGSAATCPGYQR